MKHKSQVTRVVRLISVTVNAIVRPNPRTCPTRLRDQQMDNWVNTKFKIRDWHFLLELKCQELDLGFPENFGSHSFQDTKTFTQTSPLITCQRLSHWGSNSESLRDVWILRGHVDVKCFVRCDTAVCVKPATQICLSNIRNSLESVDRDINGSPRRGDILS